MIRFSRPGVAALVAATFMCVPFSAMAQTGEPAAGVALDLATARTRDISQLRYDLSLSIPITRQQPVTGTNVLQFRLSDATKPLVIDFDADGARDATITVNGIAVPTRAVNGHLVIPPTHLRRGRNTVRIAFRAGDAPFNRGDDFLYTWFVPAHARRAIPCFDQPDLKGRWTVTLIRWRAWPRADGFIAALSEYGVAKEASRTDEIDVHGPVTDAALRELARTGDVFGLVRTLRAHDHTLSLVDAKARATARIASSRP